MSINIDLSVIEKKLEKYGKTKAAEKKMKSCIKDYKKRGVRTTAGGSSMLTDEELEEAAADLMDRLKIIARKYGLPPSVLKDIDSIRCTKPYSWNNGKERRVDLYFTNDLSRESLDLEDYDGDDGLQNIIALFNNGYHARNYVYGIWEHHDYTTGNNILRTLPDSNSAYVRSRIERPALQFMQFVVDEFNRGVGNEDGAVAVLNDVYEEPE